ncbi:MAG: Na/Pi cotransporter family protein [Firmicutes bacterium]|nr:Na/Pi cotransporter family protein [Bacillota bacterium]
MDIAYGIFLLLGGIALFLFGIKYMSDSLELALGGRLRKYLSMMTGTGLKALGTGAGITALIQSSGATSILAVGFVDAGMMNLQQALYTMLGANIGTCITAQIIAFNIQDFAPLILFIGFLLTMHKGRYSTRIGAVVIGFGLLFMGIRTMGQAVTELDMDVLVANLLTSFSSPVVSLLLGILITAVIQSSSASIGILQVLAVSSAAAGITLDSVLYMVLGMNIGASTPIVIASLSGGRTSRRAAFSNVISKVAGVLIFAVLILIVPRVIDWLKQISPGDISRQIANLHLLFNLVSSFAVYPLVGLICRLAEKLYPDQGADDPTEQRMRYISNETLNLRPGTAATMAKREVLRMGNIAYDNLALAIDSTLSGDRSNYDRVMAVEKTLNFLSHEIIGFLVRLNAKPLGEHESQSVGMMFHVVSDIERIGDHAENIIEYVDVMERDGSSFSESGLEEMREMGNTVLAALALALDVYAKDDFDRLDEVNQLEERVDELQEILGENHLGRLKAGYCNSRGGVIFTDMISDLERCSDHAMNIALAIKGEPTVVIR